MHGLSVGSGCGAINVTRAWVHDLGGNGLAFASPDTARAVVSDSVVDDVGHIFLSQPSGIQLKGQDMVATHNLVQRVP